MCVKAVVQLENKGSILHKGNLDVVCHSSDHCPKPSLLLSLWKSLSFWSWKRQAQPARAGNSPSQHVLVPTGLSAKAMYWLNPPELEAGVSKGRKSGPVVTEKKHAAFAGPWSAIRLSPLTELPSFQLSCTLTGGVQGPTPRIGPCAPTAAHAMGVGCA